MLYVQLAVCMTVCLFVRFWRNQEKISCGGGQILYNGRLWQMKLVRWEQMSCRRKHHKRRWTCPKEMLLATQLSVPLEVSLMSATHSEHVVCNFCIHKKKTDVHKIISCPALCCIIVTAVNRAMTEMILVNQWSQGNTWFLYMSLISAIFALTCCPSYLLHYISVNKLCLHVCGMVNLIMCYRNFKNLNINKDSCISFCSCQWVIVSLFLFLFSSNTTLLWPLHSLCHENRASFFQGTDWIVHSILSACYI